MLLIRRFEERAGEMYAKAKVGGFLHLCIGEEATIVGAVNALRDSDYLMSTYREHGQALARGTSPDAVMAELFGRAGGISKGRGGSMHLFDWERRFLGGYGIVGGNLPLATGVALACDYMGTDDAIVCMFGDGASNTGNFGETMNLAALWKLPIFFLVENNLYGMGTSVERHSAQTDLSKKAEGYGITGTRVDGMDVVAVREGVAEGLRLAREEQRPTLLEAFTYRYRGHSAADPEVYRKREEVEEWQHKDPIETFARRCVEAGVLGEREVQQVRDEAEEAVKAAVEFAEASPEPPLASMYEGLYARTEADGWYAVDERSPEPHRGEREDEIPAAAHELAEAGAAYAEEPAGERPNPATHGDAQEGTEPRVSAEYEIADEPEEVRAASDESEDEA
jgi:pyruvate dehydrogenase E1 component alpha subunit